MHTKSGSSIWSSSWTSIGSYCSTSWSHCWQTSQLNVRVSHRAQQELHMFEKTAPHLGLHRIGQEAANFPHSLLNLCLRRILLQYFINVRHSCLANAAVVTSLETCLVEGNWKELAKNNTLSICVNTSETNWSNHLVDCLHPCVFKLSTKWLIRVWLQLPCDQINKQLLRH